MNIIEASYIVNTKMFLGSADSKIAEIRSPSFKGILRFWFRALALAELNGNTDEVEKLEGILFGTTISTDGKKAQKALYSLKIQQQNIKVGGRGSEERGPGISYLAYGINNYDNRSRKNLYTRDYIEKDAKLKIILMENIGIKRNIDETDFKLAQKLLLNTLKIVGIFGGLGSRSRKGFGSLTLAKLELINSKKNRQTLIDSIYCGNDNELKNEINNLLEKTKEYGKSPDNIPYTALSKFTKTIITKKFNSAAEVLDEIGKEMLRYRSYGRNGRVQVLGEESEQIFKDDHDLVYDFTINNSINKHPRRVVFGLPHNYFFSGGGKKVYINSTHRRSSPLFIHVHRLENKKYIGILTLIPAKFLKDEDKIKISSKGKESKTLKATISYNVIEDFLDRIVDKMEGTKII